METSNVDTFLKPTLSSTKSIDEGFESDPDREQSNAESDSSLLAGITQQSASIESASATATSSIASNHHQQHTFDVLQRTDRDGVQHTQITRRPIQQQQQLDHTGTLSASGNLRQRKKELEKNRIVYSSSKVSIPRAGSVALNSNINRIQIVSSGSSAQQQQHQQQQMSILSAGNHDMQHHRRMVGKSIELNGTRLAKSGELLLRSSNGNATFPSAIDKHSQVALINGKLICVNMPVTQIIPATAMAAPHNHTVLSKRHFSNGNANSNSNNIIVSNQATKINQYPSASQHHHNQKYISSGRSNGDHNASANSSSVAHLVNNAIIQNANSSIHTFYPAEGNISLIPSQYGLKYKSSNGAASLHEQPAPIKMWSQSLARQPRR